MNQGVPELVARPISGNPSNHEEFLQRLQHFSSHLGDPKRSQTMTPCFRNGSHWYSQRDRNPTEGPVEGMANFLSDLFKEEQSLNSYRSAISTLHSKVLVDVLQSSEVWISKNDKQKSSILLCTYYIESTQIKAVSSATYLEVTFSISIVFHKANKWRKNL